MMDLRLVLPLGLSAMSVGVGLALRGGSSAGLGGALVVVGVVAAGCVVAMLVARALGASRWRVGGTSASCSTSVLALRDQLVQVAEAIHRKGLLGASEIRLNTGQELFEVGTKHLINARSVIELRSHMDSAAKSHSVAMTSGARRAAMLGHWGAALALTLAIGLTISTVLATRPGEAPGMSAVALLVLIYGAFMLAVVSHEVGMRTMGRVAEYELSATLITEAVLAMHSEQSPANVREQLDRLLPPPLRTARPGADATREAA